MKRLQGVFIILTLVCATDVWASPQSGEPQSPGVYSHEVVLPTPEPVVEELEKGIKDNKQELEVNKGISLSSEKTSGYALLEFCKDNFPNAEVIGCFQLVKGQEFLSSALGLCKNNTSSSGYKRRCLEITASQNFQGSLLEICGYLKDGGLNKCLETVKGKGEPPTSDYMICKEVAKSEINKCLWQFIPEYQGVVSGYIRVEAGGAYMRTPLLELRPFEDARDFFEDKVYEVCLEEAGKKGVWNSYLDEVYWEWFVSGEVVRIDYRESGHYSSREDLCNSARRAVLRNFDLLSSKQ